MDVKSLSPREADTDAIRETWEQQLVQRLLPAGPLCEDRITRLTTINLYVTLKSRPLAILVGPKNSGKTRLVQRLARLLVGDDKRFCTMVGHARWAAHSAHVGMLVEAQARLNKSALFAFMEEAWQEYARQVYITCLERISPAELKPFFTPAGLELLFGQFLQSNELHALPILPYPPNLTLIGTMDASRFFWWEAPLLERTTVVPWPAEAMTEQASQAEPAMTYGAFFLSACLRSPAMAYARLSHMARTLDEPFAPLVRVATALEEEMVALPRRVIHTIVTIAANAWTAGGGGLFDEEPAANLEIALKLGIVQHALPWLQTNGKLSLPIRDGLYRLLGEPYVSLARILVG